MRGPILSPLAAILLVLVLLWSVAFISNFRAENAPNRAYTPVYSPLAAFAVESAGEQTTPPVPADTADIRTCQHCDQEATFYCDYCGKVFLCGDHLCEHLLS